MIAIVNVSPDASPTGENEYEVRINQRVICRFTHDRYPGGLSRCLREAADAVDEQQEKRVRF